MTEHYGPDGETVEAWVGHLIPLAEEGMQMLIITGTR